MLSVCTQRCKYCLDIDVNKCIACYDKFRLNAKGFCAENCPAFQVYDFDTDSCNFLCYSGYISSCKTCYGPGQYHCLSCFDHYELNSEYDYCDVKCNSDQKISEFVFKETNRCQIVDCFSMDFGVQGHFDIKKKE